MASAVAEHKWLAGNLVQIWDHDPGATTAIIVSPNGGTTKRVVDMRDHYRFVLAVAQTVLGGNGVTKIEIVAAQDEAMSLNLTVIKDSGVIAADALCDWAVLECSADEIAHAGNTLSPGLRYVAGRITCHHAGDEAIAIYILPEPRWKHLNKTPATTISA